MATIIDSLLVTLGLDASGYKKGSKEAIDAIKKTGDESDKATKGIEKQAKRAADAYGKIRNEVLGLLGSFLTLRGLKAFGENVSAADMAVGRLSKALGINAETLSAWEGMAKRLGSSAEEVDQAFDVLSKARNDILTNKGDSPLVQSLGRLAGGAEIIQKLTDKNVSLDEVQRLVAQSMAKSGMAAAQNWGQQAGYARNLISVLVEQGAQIDAQLEKQRQLGVVTQADIDAASKRSQAWAGLITVLERIANNILQDLSPTIEGAVGWLTKFFEYFKNHSTQAEIALAVLLTGFSGLAVVSFAGLIASIGGVTAGITAATAAAGLMGTALKFAGAVGLAGGAGAWVGGKIYDSLSTSTQDKIGGMVAEVLDRFGFGQDGGAGATPAATPAGAPYAPAAGPSAVASSKGGASLPRGMRNNNPGNLNFVGQAGASKESGPNGRFAVFNSMAEGVAALDKQLQLYAKRGKDTISQIIKTYAPASENDTAGYISQLSKSLGVGANEKLDMGNAGVMAKLIDGIARIENGRSLDPAQINAGLAISRGTANNARLAGAGGQAGNSMTDVKINNVTINTKATDAAGIARDFSSGVRASYGFGTSAAVGAS